MSKLIIKGVPILVMPQAAVNFKERSQDAMPRSSWCDDRRSKHE